MIKHILWGLFFVVISGKAFTQKNYVSWEFNYDHFGIKNGLPSSETYQVYQDKSGLLWILTDRGVVRYDGFEFYRYTVKNGLCDNVNFRIIEAPDGGLWFVGFNGLLSIYKGGKMQAYKYNQALKKAAVFERNTNISLHVNKDNSIVYSVLTKKILLISKNGKVKDLFPKVSNNGYFFEFGDELMPFKNGGIKEPDTVFFVRNYRRVFAGKLLFSGTNRAKKHKGYNFIISEAKFYLVDNKSFRLLSDEKDVISLDSDNQFLYVGFYKNGVKKYRFDPKTKELILVQHYLSNYSVSSVYKDFNGNLWFTTLENGVFVIYDEAFKQLAINGNNLSEEIRFINGNKDKIIITHYVGKWQQLYAPFLCKDIGKMVYKYHLVPFRDGFAFRSGIVDWSGWKDVDATYIINPIYASDSSVVGTRGDLSQIIEIKKHGNIFYDLNQVKKTKLNGSYFMLHLDSNKKIFIPFDEGVFVFDIKSSKIESKYRMVLKKHIGQLKYNKVWGLIACSNSDGLFDINIDTEKYSGFAQNAGKQILTFFFDEKNRLWVASEKGLFLLVKEKGKVLTKGFINKKFLSSHEITDLYAYNNFFI